MTMEKRYGATKRNDGLMQIGRNKWELIYGYGTDGERGWDWRERFSYKPSLDEIKSIIIAEINNRIDSDILSGFEWKGTRVYLSSENQFNFKAAYDMAEMSQGATLPVTFKLGETEDGNPIYHEFSELGDFQDFYSKVMMHITDTLKAGWKEKDSVDWSAFI